MKAELDFPGVRPQSKRNSQFRNGYAYVEPHYKEWRQAFGALAKAQWGDRAPLAEPIATQLVVATASGVIRGDLDNVLAAVHDGLMDGQVISDDRWVRRFQAEVRKVPRANVGLWVRIETC